VFEKNKKNYAVIRKTRYVIKYKGFKFEVDVYSDLSIITLEIELPSINHYFEYPEGLHEEVLMDVTGMKQFSNLNLAKKIIK
jgi:CYTH domain-containing protein